MSKLERLDESEPLETLPYDSNIASQVVNLTEALNKAIMRINELEVKLKNAPEGESQDSSNPSVGLDNYTPYPQSHNNGGGVMPIFNEKEYDDIPGEDDTPSNFDEKLKTICYKLMISGELDPVDVDEQFPETIAAIKTAITEVIEDTLIFNSDMGDTNKYWTRGVKDTRTQLRTAMGLEKGEDNE